MPTRPKGNGSFRPGDDGKWIIQLNIYEGRTPRALIFEVDIIPDESMIFAIEDAYTAGVKVAQRNVRCALGLLNED